MRCRRRPAWVDVTPYKKGMEDGWQASEPFLTGTAGKLFLKKGDLVVTLLDGTRYPISRKKFLEEYDIIPEYAEETVAVDTLRSLQLSIREMKQTAEKWVIENGGDNENTR
jgi:hypothetical protein